MRPRTKSKEYRPPRQYKTALLLVISFTLGFYFQLLRFYSHVKHGFTGEVLTSHDHRSMREFHKEEIQSRMKIILFVSKQSNWDYIGLIASPHTILFAHIDVEIPLSLFNSVDTILHEGVDSYLNLHNKTITVMHHVYKQNSQNHFFKQDDDAIVFWPHFYDCMQKCRDLSTCYAGDMHVNIGDLSNRNSYVFATGGSYFVGNKLLKCILESPFYVERTGLDFGEDKTIGKMIFFNNCMVQYVSCKWFNNKEIYSTNTHIRMKKGRSNEIKSDQILAGKDQKL
uniref:cGMPdependent protein kinase putative n=1 Tax=Albugo laibachii Nc14 TaxID=890382 RepID=F0WCX1_9STRA|nr:cGMPdependent protein kinase putative [Albugo laibachii Nc14]|eukprot:CCA19042.1 cGMPdependent protein kinase putative [Albugo laibachii Nc14]